MRSLSMVGLALLISSVFGDEKKIPLSEVPKNVIAAVEQKFPGAKLVGAETEKENGETVYEVGFQYQDHKYDAVVTKDGTISATEKTITVKELPEAVARSLKERWSRAKVGKLEEITKGEKVTYEAKITIPRQNKPMTVEVTFDANGKVVNWENPETKVALSNVPAKVMDTFKSRFAGAELLKAEKEVEDGKTLYELTFNHDGQRKEAEFSPEGQFLEVEIPIQLENIPEAGTKAIRDKYPGATFRHTAKVTKADGSIGYEVIIATADNRAGEVVLDAAGKIVETKGLDNKKKD